MSKLTRNVMLGGVTLPTGTSVDKKAGVHGIEKLTKDGKLYVTKEKLNAEGKLILVKEALSNEEIFTILKENGHFDPVKKEKPPVLGRSIMTAEDLGTAVPTGDDVTLGVIPTPA